MKSLLHYLRQVKHQFWLFMLFLEGIKDKRRLYEDFPKLRSLALSASRSKLSSSYSNYISSISSEKMAVSLETAAFLFDLCAVLKPKSILDLGSGYSTSIFMKYKGRQKNQVDILSVDDSKNWLEKTKSFLKQQKLILPKFHELKSFKKEYTSKWPFDLIFYDLGWMETRKKEFPNMLKVTKKGSLIIIDDIHMLDYSRLVRKQVMQEKINFYSLRSLTKDKYKRFAVLIQK